MKLNAISENIAEFKATKNPLYLAKAIQLLINQRRTLEAVYGIYCQMFFRPSVVKSRPQKKMQAVLEDCQLLLSTRAYLSREELINVFGDDYAVHRLPADFCLARMEAIVSDKDFLIIGEYGPINKRIAYITQQTCVIDEFYYFKNPHVRHIHAVYKSPYSRDVLITTGDSSKFLDLWSMQNDGIKFCKRLKTYLAGYTAILKVGSEYYFGTDFTNRPNYIETLDGRKFFYPEKANKMFVIGFQQYLNRYLVSLNKETEPSGKRFALSIFDTEHKEFVYCEYTDYIQPETANKAVQREATSLRSIAAAEL